MCVSFLCLVDPHEREEKDNTKGTIRIYAKSTHQMGHTLGGQKQAKKQVVAPTK